MINNIIGTFSKIIGVETNAKESVVIPIGIDTKIFYPETDPKKNAILDGEKINARSTVCSVLTRFSPADKADLLPLIHSIAYNTQCPDSGLTFLLLGGDCYYGARQYIEILEREVDRLGVADFVRILRINERERVVNLLRASDIFLSPADNVQETYGITPIEAMACGVVPIVSDWNGYRETVVDETIGFRAPTTFFNNTEIWESSAFSSHYRDQHLLLGQSVFVDTNYMINKCIALDSDRDYLDRMKLNALSKIEEKYTWKTIISMYENVWDDLSTSSRHESFLGKKIDYWGTFNHYATKLASDEDQYVISNYGKNVILGNVQLQIFSGLKDVISMDLIERILEQASIQSVSVPMIAYNTKFSLSKTRFCFSFLLKQGLLSITQ